MKSVYSIGCSWIHEFNMQLAKSKKIQGCGSVTAPKRSQGLYSEGLAGHGLNHIKEILKFSSEMSEYQEKDVLLVQLPTPVRGILRDGHRPRTNTKGYIEAYKDLVETIGVEEAEEDLFSYYKKCLEEINSFHKNVVFFIFNTGGYPFRHPLDFGSTAQKEIISFLKEKKFNHLIVDYEGLPDCGRIEQYGSKKDLERILNKPKSVPSYKSHIPDWLTNCIHPPGKIILDAHPNKDAALKAVAALEDYVENFMRE